MLFSLFNNETLRKKIKVVRQWHNKGSRKNRKNRYSTGAMCISIQISHSKKFYLETVGNVKSTFYLGDIFTIIKFCVKNQNIFQLRGTFFDFKEISLKYKRVIPQNN